MPIIARIKQNSGIIGTMKKKILTIIIVAIVSLIALAAVIVAAIYFWPLRSSALQTGTPKIISYQQSITQFESTKRSEAARNVTDTCQTKLQTHGQKTAKVVVMLHGVTACPNQFDSLAKVFFDAGYNVYIPRAPYHGTADKKDHGQVTSRNLVDYVNASITTATGLGDELGVVGLSGGGMLATWASEYRPEVKSALVLSPFYEPAATQAPKWQLPFLHVLYGFHILPDTFIEPATPDGAAFSYRALANYDIVAKNFKKDPSGLSLKNLAVVTSASDDQIDLDLAKSIPQSIASANNIPIIATDLPADWNVGHDIVSLENKEVVARQNSLFRLYFNSYENRPTEL